MKEKLLYWVSFVTREQDDPSKKNRKNKTVVKKGIKAHESDS